MPSQPPRAPADGVDRYHGFSLDRVGWGHRELFERRLGSLFEHGLIGPHRAAVTATLFSLLRQADQGAYDPVLHRFLDAINPHTEWLLDLPALFAEVVDLGRALAATQPQRGSAFFTLLGEAGLGQTAEQVRHTLWLARRLLDVDADLSLAFLRGSARLAERLQPADLERFVTAGLAAYARNPLSGLAFMQGSLNSAETLVRTLAQECRLHEIRGALSALVGALAGPEFVLADLGCLPGADVARRGCVLLGRTLYLPARVHWSPSRQLNRGWYTLAVVVAAGTLRYESFSRIHGQPRYPTLRALVGTDPLALNVLLLAEWQRVLTGCTRDWPGARRLLQAALEHDLLPGAGAAAMPATARRLLLAPSTALPEPLGGLVAAAQACHSVHGTAALLTPSRLADLRHACPDLAGEPLPPLSYMPDALFPASGSTPSADSAQPAWPGAGGGNRGPRGSAPPQPAARPPADTEASAEHGTVYDEWDDAVHDYRRDHCHVYEIIPAAGPDAPLPVNLVAEGQRVRRAFERLRPPSARREKHLDAGDEIDVDRLVHFVVQRRVEPAPSIDFYEKPRPKRRDLAVLVLLDLSGSTGDLTPTGERILDLERRAALALGQGLHTLGDRFAVCGFNSAGARQCTFLVFKDFSDPWEHPTLARLLTAVPAHRTRIGPALRHAGRRLAQIPCRQRLILLITDGRPADTGYDPTTHYAQTDVRKACEENAQRGVQTFAVATGESSTTDLQDMFPGHHFAVLPDILHLPHALLQLYARLTL